MTMNRREALVTLGLTAAAPAALATESPKPTKRIKQSVCRWCYGRIDLDRLAERAARIGYQSIELLGPDEIRQVKKHGLTCAVMRCQSGIVNGLNRTENHARILRELREDIDFAAAEGIPNVLTMSGNRRGMDDEQGLKNCAEALKQIVGYAEEKKVTILMEGLNSKIDHKDYMYDKTAWGVRLCEAVGSERFKLLYDIYHMQIMEGDIIRTIRTHAKYLGHFHTGGNPGRNEIDDSQELNYAAILRAIVETGYTGFVGQEFIPKRDPFESLAQAFTICDV
jgi:hydroxypyruvate isomerase